MGARTNPLLGSHRLRRASRLLTLGGALTLWLVGAVAAREPQPTPAASPPPAALEGTVKGPDGRPVENALVVVWGEPLRRMQAPGATRTDASGTFRVILRERAASYGVRVEASGRLAHTVTGARPGTRLAITLEKGLTIDGVVLDGRTRRPIPRADVVGNEFGRLLPTPPAEPDAGLVRATSDDKGRYRLTGLGLGTYRVSATAPGYGRSEGHAAGGTTGVDLFLWTGASISGVVTGPDKQPVPRARVSAESELPMSSVQVTPATTDARGGFRLLGLDEGSYRLFVKAKDLAPAVFQGVTVDDGADRGVEIRLERPYRVRGRLVNSERQPVRGSVRVQELDGAELPRAEAFVLTAEAESDGRFEIAGLPPGSHALGVSPQGFPPRRVAVSVGGEEAVVDVGDVEFPAGLTIRGRVRERSGAPIVDATVTASQHDRRVTTRCESDGAFVLAGLEPGVHEVRADAPGFAFETRRAEPGETVVEFVLEKAGGIAGTIVDESGRPVVPYSVVARPMKAKSGQNAMVGPETPVGADGRFTIDGLLAGPHAVGIFAEGFVPHTTPELAVETGQVTDAGRIVLARGGSVQGVVVDGRGEPVAGAEVSLVLPRRGASTYTERKATGSDAQGRFHLQGLSPGTATLLASHPRYATSDPAEVAIDPEQGPAAARLVLIEGGRIAGIVRRREATAKVQLFVQAWPRGASPFAGQLRTRVGEDGAFAVEHLKPGRASVVLVAGQGGVYGSVWSTELDVRDGETTSVEVALADVRVHGRVVRGGAAAPGLRLELRPEAGLSIHTGPPAVRDDGLEPMRATTREDGTYDMIVPVPGRYRVSLSAPGRMQTLPAAYRTVEVPDADSFQFDIDLPDAAVSGLVLAGDTRRPIGFASVTATASGGDVQRTMTSDDGRFELSLEAGSYAVRVTAPEYVVEETTVEIASGQSVQRTFRLARGRSLKARVADAQGRPVASAMLIAASADGRIVRSGRTKDDGSVEVGGLTPGQYHLLAASERVGFALLGGVAAGSDDPPATLTLTPPARVRLQFRDDKGGAVARTPVVVELLRVDGVVVGMAGAVSYESQPTTNEEGSAEITLPPGRVELAAFARDRADLRADLSLEIGPDEGALVTVVLRRQR